MVSYISNILKVCADNIDTVIRGDFTEGSTDLNDLCNLALLRVDRKLVTPSAKDLPPLTAEQKAAVKRLYGPYFMYISDRYHRLYTHVTGRFSPYFMPEDIFGLIIDRYYSDRAESKYLDNKCYYYRLFPDIKQPEPVALRIGGTWLDGGMNPVSYGKVSALVSKETEIVLKRAVNSQGGYGVHFISGEHIARDLDNTLRDIGCDVVIQRPVKQHPQLSRLHPQSVNTVRLVSLMTGDRVKVYSAALKIGLGESRTDNGCQGGMYCGLFPDGRLRDYAITDDGVRVTKYTNHPELGYSFSLQRVPNFKNAVALVKRAHSFMGHFRLISWDVTVDDKGDAVLIEANLSLGGINDIQMCSGPLFGRDTKMILDEAIGKRKRLCVLL